jgi:ACT domain-containing protein
MTTDYKALLTQTAKSAKITRLIAEENITVEYSSTATTASFQPDTRVITYPYSMAMEDDDIHMTFVFHEVAHALFSKSNELFKRSIEKNIKDEFNITEDIRIERLIKHRYPGVVKNFNEAYKKLLERGFFGPIEKIPFYGFASRLNAYAKLGPINGKFIKFDKNEIEFYNRCMTANTEQEAYDLAVELKELSAGDHNKILGKLLDLTEMDEDDIPSFVVDEFSTDVSMDGEEEGDEDGEEQQFDPNQVNYGYSEFDRESMTQEALERLAERLEEISSQYIFEKEFEKTTISDCSVSSYSPASKNIIKCISAKTYYKEISKNESVNFYLTSMRNFRDSVAQSIDAMVKEFEAKKAAYRSKHARISDTGRIDINRLANYKFSDNIFSKEIFLADSKNHGFVILLDCSGSISSMYKDMVNQVIVLVDFFRRIGVKYKVIGYGMEWTGSYDILPKNDHVCITNHSMTSNDRSTIIEFLNNSMTNSEHLLACTAVYHKFFFQLGDTPTMNAFAQIEHIAHDFFNENKIQIKKVINITDGQPTDFSSAFAYNYTDSYNRSHKSIVVDPMTRKTYMSQRYSYAPVDMIGKIFKDRYDISVASIAIAKSLSGNLTSFTGKHANAEDVSNFKNRGYVFKTSTNGNHVYVVKSSAVETDLDFSDVDGEASVRKNATIFKKTLMKNRKTKNFLMILSKYLAI